MEHAPSAFPEARGPIGQMIQALSWEAQGIPVVQHLAPRHTKPGTLDLTASTLFVRAVDKHALICKFAQQLKKWYPSATAKQTFQVSSKCFSGHSMHCICCGRKKKNTVNPQ